MLPSFIDVFQLTASAKFVTKTGETIQGREKKDGKSCQIYTKKGHVSMNFYFRFNLQRFPPQHTRQLALTGQTPFMNLVEHMMVWYPDSGSMNHITASTESVISVRSISVNFLISSADGHPCLSSNLVILFLLVIGNVLS